MSILEILDLTEDERTRPPKALGRLKTVNEWMSSAVESVKDNKEFIKSLSELSPWADAAFEAVKDVIPPLRFVAKLFSELTKVQDPSALARVAATLAYQSAAEKAFRCLGGPDGRAPSELPGLPESEDADFGSLNLQNAAAHEFMRKADYVLAYHAERVGYTKDQVNRVVRQVHGAFSEELATLLSHGDTKEKFDPLLRWLNVTEEWASTRAAIRRHAEYLDWLFQKSPVFQHEPFALADIYVEPECSRLTRGELTEEPWADRPRRNPVLEGKYHGDRLDLAHTVMSLIGSDDFADAIVIQGSAGSGKSTFTLCLASMLHREGLRPIRIRLRHVPIEKEFFSALGEAVAYEDETFLRERGAFSWPTDILRDGMIFDERLPFGDGGAMICPYVLILDGWDEISVAVSEGFKQRVKDLLMNIRREMRRRPGLRVILTGRPTDAIDECADFFRTARLS